MATQTALIGSMEDGTLLVDLSYDDVTGVALSLAATNNTGAGVTLMAGNDLATGTHRFPVGAHSWALPTGIFCMDDTVICNLTWGSA